MENFDYKKYLKNNPLLNEEEITKEDLGRTGDSWGYEGGGIPDSDVEDKDHEHEWEDTGDEEGMFTGEEECKICGLRRSVYDENKKFKDYEGPSIEDVASRPENIEKWQTKEGKISKSQLREMIWKIISEDGGRTDAKTILSSVDIDAKDISNDPRFKDSIKTGEAIYTTSVPEQQVEKKLK